MAWDTSKSPGDPILSADWNAMTADQKDRIDEDGTVPLTANWDAGAFEIRALSFQSDIVTGTAPLIVASTTVVANLNVDQVDGHDMDQDVLIASNVQFANVTVNNTGLHILDTNASHDLIIAPGSDLTADRTLTVTTGDAARTLTLSGNATLDDWFDQAVKQASSPILAGLTMTGNIDVGDGNYLKTDQVRAYDAAGLSLFEDGGKGIFVEDSTGDVGIGTITPDAKLVTVVNTASRPTIIRIHNDNTGGYCGALTFSGGYLGGYDFGDIVAENSGSGGLLRVRTADTAGTLQDRLSITHEGNVGINTSEPDARLDILDNTNPQLRLTHTDGSVYVDLQAESDGDLSIEPSGSNINIIDKNLLLGTTTGTQFGTATTQKLAFYGSTPIVQPAAYTPSNVTPDRSFDADTVAVAELADVVGTLIADLQSLGLVG